MIQFDEYFHSWVVNNHQLALHFHESWPPATSLSDCQQESLQDLDLKFGVIFLLFTVVFEGASTFFSANGFFNALDKQMIFFQVFEGAKSFCFFSMGIQG